MIQNLSYNSHKTFHEIVSLRKFQFRAIVGVKERRYKLWLSGNSDGTGGVEVLVKGELFEKVVEV